MRRSTAGTIGLVLVAGVWCATALFVALLAARWVALDASRTLTLLNAQTVWLYLPVYAIASAALCARRWVLVDVWELKGTGSDHKPVVAEIVALR